MPIDRGMLKFIFVLSLFPIFLGCASSNYRIQTSPSDVEVEVVYKSGLKKSLGKSPVSMTSQDINPNKESLQLNLKKNGYESTSIFVPESPFQKNLEVLVNLKPDENKGETCKNDQTWNIIAASVADIQKDIQMKSYEIASTKINRMLADYPSVATFHSLNGNVHYLEKRIEKALASYRRAYELNPNSAELQRIIEKLSSMTGGTK